ncbi:MAG: coproporphyrinogen III oxidase, partial [Flavobacteriaceae bacterium]|nr:coproporphyrinogen III oxidase [Flavobacteriaceae bacterium]
IQAIYGNKLPSTVELLSEKDRFNEYIMTGLRTIWGVSLVKIQNDFKPEFRNYLLKNAEPYLDNGQLEIIDKKIVATHNGKFLIDGIASELFMI